MSIHYKILRVLRYVKPLDVVIIAGYLVLLVMLSLFIFDRGTGLSQVEIKTAQDTFIYQLQENATLSFQGPLGVTSVIIQDEKVSVTDSPGPLKICIKSSPIENNGEWLACLPNRIFIRIVKQSKNTDDAIDAIVF